jgi:GNAT superfamily N-acetyltransferase
VDYNNIDQLKIFSPNSITELNAGIKVVNSAFGRPVDLALERQTQLWKGFQIENIADFRFASIDNQIIGTCGLFHYDILGWIGFMAVDPHFRNQHIGKRLIREILSIGESYNLTTFRLDATELGKRVYKNFDFQVQYPVGLYQLSKKICSISDPAELPQLTTQIPNWLLQKDRDIFGADRSKLLSNIFHQGKLLIGKQESYAFIIDDRIGPIIASTWEEAIDLIAVAQDLGVQKIYIPHHTDLPQQYLENLGIIQGQGAMCIRMIRGTDIQEENKNIYAIHSFSAG